MRYIYGKDRNKFVIRTSFLALRIIFIGNTNRQAREHVRFTRFLWVFKEAGYDGENGIHQFHWSLFKIRSGVAKWSVLDSGVVPIIYSATARQNFGAMKHGFIFVITRILPI